MLGKGVRLCAAPGKVFLMPRFSVCGSGKAPRVVPRNTFHPVRPHGHLVFICVHPVHPLQKNASLRPREAEGGPVQTRLDTAVQLARHQNVDMPWTLFTRGRDKALALLPNKKANALRPCHKVQRKTPPSEDSGVSETAGSEEIRPSSTSRIPPDAACARNDRPRSISVRYSFRSDPC